MTALLISSGLTAPNGQRFSDPWNYDGGEFLRSNAYYLRTPACCCCLRYCATRRAIRYATEGGYRSIIAPCSPGWLRWWQKNNGAGLYRSPNRDAGAGFVDDSHVVGTQTTAILQRAPPFGWGSRWFESHRCRSHRLSACGGRWWQQMVLVVFKQKCSRRASFDGPAFGKHEEAV
jgi:hypothetical protein